MKHIKKFNESVEDSQKAYKITIKLIDGNIKNLRYPSVYIRGVLSTLINNYGLSKSQEVIDGFKEAIIDFMSDIYGCEPTFYNDEAYNYWENLSFDTIYPIPRQIFE